MEFELSKQRMKLEVLYSQRPNKQDVAVQATVPTHTVATQLQLSPLRGMYAMPQLSALSRQP